MDQDLKKLRKLVRFMQKEGVLTLKVREIELQLSPSAIIYPDAPVAQATEAGTDTPQLPEYTEEELLMWSAPGLPEEQH